MTFQNLRLFDGVQSHFLTSLFLIPPPPASPSLLCVEGKNYTPKYHFSHRYLDFTGVLLCTDLPYLESVSLF